MALRTDMRGALMVNPAYMDGLMQVSEQLGAWIEAAQADGSLNRNLPPIC